MVAFLSRASWTSRNLGLGLAVLLAAACSSSGGDTGDAGDAGNEGGDAGLVTGGCDPNQLPTDNPCVVADVDGVFVSSSLGSASGDGTKAKPLASLNAGIAAAKAAKKRVYACAETYAETVTLESGVSVFGYFDCTKGWAVGAAHAKVQPTTSPAATAANITDPTRVEAVDLVAPDFTDKSQSSIGLVASASPALTIVDATIHAGTGGKGADGVDGVQLTDSGAAKKGADSWAKGACTGTFCAGLLATHGGGAAGGTNTCTGATGHDGGSGGNGGAAGEYTSSTDSSGITYHWYPVSNYPTTGGSPSQATAQTAVGGLVGLGNAGASGASGADGANGTAGGAAGTFSASGYAPSDGTAGGDGQPGQGGGGAGAYGLQDLDTDYPPQSYPSYSGWGESGAGGGAGGCPGLAGQLGKGGGASVAVLALQSPFTLDTVTLEAGSGGAGGAAGKPSVPLAGGSGGAAAKYTGGGGAGGSGGHAGVSGNGGGGPSIGLAYQGTEPTLKASTLTPGAGGAGVAQRVANGQTIPASPDGLSKDTYSF